MHLGSTDVAPSPVVEGGAALPPVTWNPGTLTQSRHPEDERVPGPATRPQASEARGCHGPKGARTGISLEPPDAARSGRHPGPGLLAARPGRDSAVRAPGPRSPVTAGTGDARAGPPEKPKSRTDAETDPRAGHRAAGAARDARRQHINENRRFHQKFEISAKE